MQFGARSHPVLGATLRSIDLSCFLVLNAFMACYVYTLVYINATIITIRSLRSYCAISRCSSVTVLGWY